MGVVDTFGPSLQSFLPLFKIGECTGEKNGQIHIFQIVFPMSKNDLKFSKEDFFDFCTPFCVKICNANFCHLGIPLFQKT
jgi:hypothetical protein